MSNSDGIMPIGNLTFNYQFYKKTSPNYSSFASFASFASITFNKIRKPIFKIQKA